MVKLLFEVQPYDPNEISGLDLGHLTIDLGQTKFSSIEGGAPFLMMIYLSIPALVDGLVDLISGTKKRFEFVGVDSSFVVNFNMKINVIHITGQGKQVSVSKTELVIGFLDSIEKLYKKLIIDIKNDDYVLEDIDSSLNRLRRIDIV